MVLSIILLQGSISALTNFALVTGNSDVTRLGKGCHPGVIAQWLESFFLYRASAL